MGYNKSKADKIANFIKTLVNILNEQKNQNIIGWSKNGDCIQIYNINKFTSVILPQYFKHSNLSSFVRQLNIYGFRKLPEEDSIQGYSHPQFQRDLPQNYPKIKRRIKQGQEGIIDQVKESENEHQQGRKVSDRERELIEQNQQLKQQNNQLIYRESVLAGQCNKLSLIYEKMNSYGQISKEDDQFLKQCFQKKDNNEEKSVEKQNEEERNQNSEQLQEQCVCK